MKVQPFSLEQATILDSPDNFAFFTETAKITDAGHGTERDQRRLHQEERPRSLARYLPAGILGSDSGTASAWRSISTASWYASAPIEMWNDRLEGGGPPQDYALNWFYNPTRWAPMTFHQPQPGETIGFFVVAGDVRGFNSNQKLPGALERRARADARWRRRDLHVQHVRRVDSPPALASSDPCRSRHRGSARFRSLPHT